MAGETPLTIVGNLTADPELRFTSSGAAVANFTVASTPRTFDRQSGEWKDGESLFMRCSIWRDAAEHVAESLMKGMRVVVTGRLRQRSYETQQGEKRTTVEMEVDEVGPSLKYATAQVTKMTRSSGGGPGGGFSQGGGQQQPQQRQQQPQQQRQDDPWATGPAMGGNSQPSGGDNSGGNWGGTFDNEPPF